MLFDVSIIAFLSLRYPLVCRWIFWWIWLFRTVMYILYIYWLSFPPKEILETHWYVIQAQADYLGTYVFHMCRGDDTNTLIDLGFRTENQVQLPFMSFLLWVTWSRVALDTILDRLDNGWIFGIQILKHALFQFYFYHYFWEKIS